MKSFRFISTVFMILIFLSPILIAQQKIEVKKIEPLEKDISSIDGMINAFYEAISGPAGEPRQWDRDRTLYIDGVRFVSTGAKDGEPFYVVLDHDQYINKANDALVKNGFFESEVNRVTKTFGNIAHVFSTYEYRYDENGPVMGRGVNSIELYNDGNRWWIASAIWDEERPGNPIPADLLPASN